ncbi:MAG: hypothetical protein VYE77_10880 [Planctomycetota bacterium]|nr:hypothetical protein [Planctomycetota bacterium]
MATPIDVGLHADSEVEVLVMTTAVSTPREQDQRNANSGASYSPFFFRLFPR